MSKLILDRIDIIINKFEKIHIDNISEIKEINKEANRLKWNMNITNANEFIDKIIERNEKFINTMGVERREVIEFMYLLESVKTFISNGSLNNLNDSGYLEILKLKKEIDDLHKNNESLSKELCKSEYKNEQLKGEIDELTDVKKQLEKSIYEWHEDCFKKHEENAELKSELERVKKDLESLSRHYSKLYKR